MTFHMEAPNSGGAVKVCGKCKQTKPITEFYQKGGEEWHLRRSRCKECVREEHRQYGASHRQQNIEYQRSWRSKESRVYDPIKLHARGVIGKLIRSKKLERPTQCEKCGQTGFITAHHPDYAKPLEVQWLCKTCHELADRGPYFADR